MHNVQFNHLTQCFFDLPLLLVKPSIVNLLPIIRKQIYIYILGVGGVGVGWRGVGGPKFGENN